MSLRIPFRSRHKNALASLTKSTTRVLFVSQTIRDALPNHRQRAIRGYRGVRGTIVGEAVITLATLEYLFARPFASLTRTR